MYQQELDDGGLLPDTFHLIIATESRMYRLADNPS